MGAGAGARQSQASQHSERASSGGLHERAVSIRQKKMSHLERTRLVQTVETFTKLVYLNVDAAVSLGNFLDNSVGAEVFSRFLERESADHLVSLYLDLDRRRAGSPELLAETLERFSALFPQGHSSEEGDLRSRVERAQTQLVQELARNRFPRFLCSSEYQKWRAAERSAYSAMFLRGSVCWSDNEDGGSARSAGNREYSLSLSDRQDREERLFGSIDQQEVTRLVNTDSWLTTLLARADSLPIGVARTCPASR